jgi:hypothetical protein
LFPEARQKYLLFLYPPGEEPHAGIVAGITPGNPTLVTTVEDERLEFQEGEHWHKRATSGDAGMWESGRS